MFSFLTCKKKKRIFIHSFNIELGSRDTAVNQTDKVLDIMELIPMAERQQSGEEIHEHCNFRWWEEKMVVKWKRPFWKWETIVNSKIRRGFTRKKISFVLKIE